MNFRLLGLAFGIGVAVGFVLAVKAMRDTEQARAAAFANAPETIALLEQLQADGREIRARKWEKEVLSDES